MATALFVLAALYKSVMAAAGALLRHWRIAPALAREAGGFQALQVILPQLGLVGAEPVQVIPRIDAGVMRVGKMRLHRVIADRVQRGDQHLALAGLQRLLSCTMAA